MTPPPTHQHWAAEALWQQLEPHLPGVSVEVLARCESTNSVLLDRARRGAARHEAPITTPGELESLRQRGLPEPVASGGLHGRRSADAHPCLLVCEHQTLGRGRQGRGWLSAPSASLTFSLGLPLAPRDWSGLSLAVGVALADALEPLEPPAFSTAAKLQLKWPNDLWLRAADDDAGRKCGGVLIETVAVGGRRMVVVGVGLNIAPLPASLAAGAALQSGHSCLQELWPTLDAPAVLHRVALPLVRALRQFEREGFSGFTSAYARRDLLRGRRVAVLDPARPDATLEGLAQGVAASGALRVRDDDGTLHDIVSGDVSVRALANG